MLEVYPLLISFSVFTSTFLKKCAKLVSYYQCYFLENYYLALLIHVTPICGSCMRPAATTPPRDSGLRSCSLSTRPSVAARTPRDESPKLSNFGEIPCLLYLDITEAKGAVGQQIGGRPPLRY